MQALSIGPSMGDLFVVPQLNCELGSSCTLSSSRRRRKRWGFGDSFCHGRILRNSRDISSGFCCGSPKLDLGCGYFSRYSKLKDVYNICERKKGSFGPCAWAVEKQEIRSEFVKEDFDSIDGVSSKSEEIRSDFVKEDCNSVDGVLSKSENDDVGYLNLNGVGNIDDNDIQEENGLEAESEEEVGKGKSTRVDVRELAWSLRFAKTADDVDEVLKEKGELPLQVYSSMIRGFGKSKRMNSAMALVEWLKIKKNETNGFKGPNLFIYNSLLGALKQSEQFGLLERIMNDMAQEGILPNVVTYNTLMAIYSEQGKSAEALHVLEEIQEKGLTPSPVSYSTALLAYRRVEDGRGALKFFVELREKFLKGDIRRDPNEDWENEFVKLENFTIRICYQVMRRWLVKDENLSAKVLELLIDMDRAGLRPGRAEHERLVWACTREEHYIVAKELYIRIRESYSEISLSVCNHVIWVMGKARKWWAALEIYEDLLDKGPEPNNMSYELIVSHFNILLTAARKRGIWSWGVRLLNKMEDRGLKPGSRELNAVLVACSKASETSAAVQIFRRMVEQGEKPTIVSYGALLSALEKGKLYDEAYRVWEHMIKVGVKPNVYAYTTMVSVFTGQGKFKIVDAIIREMVASGNEPTVVTYNAIITGCARNGMSSVAYEWFHRLKVQNIEPNEVTYEMLIEALAKDGKPRLAYELYLRAYKEDLKLSTKAYDAVLQSSQVYGATIELSLLGPRPPDKKTRIQTRNTST